MPTTPPPEQLDGRYVYLDPYVIDCARLNKGLSRKELANRCNVPAHRMSKMFSGGGMLAASAKKVADFVG